MAKRNNENAVKHGAEGALKRYAQGKSFINKAFDMEQEVIAELEDVGIDEIMKRDAIRLQTLTQLFWAAIEKAVQDNDLAALDRYTARYGWLSSVALRAWAQVAANEKSRAKTAAGIVDVMEAIRKATDGNQD